MEISYTADEVVESASCFVKNLSTILEDLKTRFEALEASYLNLKGLIHGQELEDTEKFIEDEYQKQEFFVCNVDQNEINIENLESGLAKLKTLRSKKQNQCDKLEQEVSTLKEKCNSISDSTKNVTAMRDKILAYKLLTNVEFIYSTKKVKGIVTKEVPESFSFNPEELAQEDITKKLWNTILEE